MNVSAESNETGGPAGRWRWVEGSGLFILVALAVLFLAISWRKWPDPLIDFGRELYTPWRLANGAILYRDVDDIYGPLSQCLNGAIFAVFGPGLMVLVTANLVIFAVIVAFLYFLCREAWGPAGAFAASAIFIALFGFSQFVGVSNYNFATPYAHEVTHGFLVCLILTFFLARWIGEPTRRRSFICGMLLGLSALLKVEILFAAGVVTLGAVFLAWRRARAPSVSQIVAWLLGALLSTILFTAYFLRFFSPPNALRAAVRGWQTAIGSSQLTSDQIQIDFLGFDHPWKNMQLHALATLIAVLFIGAIAGVAWLSEKIRNRSVVFAIATALVLVMGGLAGFVLDWWNVGRCLLGLLTLYLISSAILRNSKAGQRAPVLRILLAFLGVALLARMILNGRIYQFGFYQAALAAVIMPAALIGEIPVRLGLGRRGRAVFLAGALALLVPGVVGLAAKSVRQLEQKNLAIGEGKDRFYAFPERIELTGKIVSLIDETIRQHTEFKTLLVLPEGVMLNYLTRLPSTVPQFFFFSAATENGGEEQIVTQLERQPPDAVVIISRNLEPYGIEVYGERPGRGQLLLRWLRDNYSTVALLGGNPLDHRDRGGVIFKRRIPSRDPN